MDRACAWAQGCRAHLVLDVGDKEFGQHLERFDVMDAIENLRCVFARSTAWSDGAAQHMISVFTYEME